MKILCSVFALIFSAQVLAEGSVSFNKLYLPLNSLHSRAPVSNYSFYRKIRYVKGNPVDDYLDAPDYAYESKHKEYCEVTYYYRKDTGEKMKEVSNFSLPDSFELSESMDISAERDHFNGAALSNKLQTYQLKNIVLNQTPDKYHKVKVNHEDYLFMPQVINCVTAGAKDKTAASVLKEHLGAMVSFGATSSSSVKVNDGKRDHKQVPMENIKVPVDTKTIQK